METDPSTLFGGRQLAVEVVAQPLNVLLQADPTTIIGGAQIAAGTIAQPLNLLLMFVAVAFGMFIGVLPGLGGVIVLALLVPVTFPLDPLVAIMVLVAANGGTSQAGSISAILINTPGTAPNAATLLDGYPLARKGEAKRAIMAALTSSAAGALLGILVLAASIPIMKELVLAFGFPEIFWLGLWGISVVSIVVRGAVIKGLISGIIGLIFVASGRNFLTASYRWTYDLTMMQNGVKFIPLLVGIFAVSEMINLIAKGETIAREDIVEVAGSRWEGVKDVYIHWWVWLRSAITGVTIGIIPGVGGVTANFIAYFQAAQSADDPDSFGTGDIRGVIASEASNDAKEGGAYLPTLAFGVPGSASMAILLGAFIVHGIVPGPTILKNNLDLVFIVVLAALVSNIMSSIIGALSVNQLVKITRVDANLFGPIIIAWGFFAGFAVTNNVFDLSFVWLGAILGFVMMRINMSRVPLVLGMVLGPIIERTYWQSLQISKTGHGIFIDSNISKVLIVLVAVTLFWPILKPVVKERVFGRIGGGA